jgi:hypothetical protein
MLLCISMLDCWRPSYDTSSSAKRRVLDSHAAYYGIDQALNDTAVD